MNSIEISNSLLKIGVKAFDVGVKGLISLYDDDWYSNSDYDMVGADDRKMIREFLLSKGWTPKGSRYFTKEGVTCAFPKPSHTLGCNPSDKVFDEISHNTVVFVTPTQALLVLAAVDKWDQEKVKMLISEQPANLDKAWQWIKEESLSGVNFKQIEELKEIQLKNFALKLG